MQFRLKRAAVVAFAVCAMPASAVAQNQPPQQQIGTAIMCDQSGCSELPTSAHCAEDDPCWTWSKMGNRKRGVTLKTGHRVVVTSCRFQRLVFAQRVDWRATPHLRGDLWAIHHGCDR